MRKVLFVIYLVLVISVIANSQTSSTARKIATSTFSNLGTPSNGEVRYCSDCTANSSPCTGSGTGAMASRVNGAWSCSTTSASGAGTVTNVSGTANQIAVASPTTTPVLSFPTNGIVANSISPGFATQATTAGTTTLTVASAQVQEFTGTLDQTVKLPVVTTLPQVGFQRVIINRSSDLVEVQSSGADSIQIMSPNTTATFTCKLLTGTTAASWVVTYVGPAGVFNSAPSGTIPKTVDGSGNLGASVITDDGNTVTLNPNSGLGIVSVLAGGFTLNSNSVIVGNLSGEAIPKVGGDGILTDSGITDSGTVIDIRSTTVRFGDTNEGANGTRTFLTDSTQTIINHAGVSVSNETPLFKVGTTNEFQIGGGAHPGTISKYKNVAPADGAVLIGDTANSEFVPATLNSGAGISIVSLAGNVTISSDGTTPKTNSIALTGQSASIGATNIQPGGVVAPAGLYRLSYYLVTTTAGTSGTVSATFGWSDIVAARTAGTGNITFGTLASPATGTVIIQANGIANITYLTTVTAAVGSPVYAFNITLERLQ